MGSHDVTEDTGHCENLGEGAVEDDRPIDTGFAWVICLAAFLITILMTSYDQVLAVVFLELVDKYDVTVSTAALVYTISSLFFGIGSVVSTNTAVARYSERVVVVVAATVNAITTIIISFSPNIVFFHGMHVIKGFCAGAMWVPAMGLVGHYFRRRRSLATSLCSAGMSASLLAFPRLVRHLVDTYGLGGAYLVLAAIEMHGVAAAMLLRPVSVYRRIRKRERDVLQAKLLYDAIETGNSKVTSTKHVTEGQNGAEHVEPMMGDSLSQHTPTLELQRIDISENQGLRNNHDSNSYDQSIASTQGGVTKGEHAVTGGEICSEDDAQFKQLLSQSSNTKDDEGASNDVDDYRVVCTRTDNERDKMKKASVTSGQGCGLNRFVDTALLSNWLVLLLLASTVHGALLQYIMAYIPTLAVHQGVGKADAATLLSIAGGVNFVGILLQGLIVDTKYITPSQFVTVAQMIVGTACHLVRSLTSFPSLVALSVTQGLLGGSRISLIPVVAVEFVDIHSVGKIIGFNALVGTLSLALHHPFLGYLRDATGDFTSSFHYVGFGLYLSSVLFLLSPVVRRLYTSRMADRPATA